MYTLKIKRPFRRMGRDVKNIGGTIVVFRDGVAYNVSEQTAKIAQRQHYIASVTLNPEVREYAAPVEEPQVAPEEEAQTVEEVVEEPAPEPVVEEEEVTERPVEENVVADTPETEDGILSAEEIQGLYDSLGTWTAVADHLGITTTTLRKYREDVGLL